VNVLERGHRVGDRVRGGWSRLYRDRQRPSALKADCEGGRPLGTEAQALVSTARLELDELVPLAVLKCREVLEAESAAVLLLDPERDELYFPYLAEEDPQARLARRRRGSWSAAKAAAEQALPLIKEAKRRPVECAAGPTT
jgi:hypothetical protein